MDCINVNVTKGKSMVGGWIIWRLYYLLNFFFVNLKTNKKTMAYLLWDAHDIFTCLEVCHELRTNSFKPFFFCSMFITYTNKIEAESLTWYTPPL